MAVHEHSGRPEELKIDSELERYFVDVSVSCPYGLDRMAVYHQAMFTSIGDDTLEMFFSRGYRRNGNCIYSMLMKKNRDVTAGIAPLRMYEENLILLDKYLKTRFPESRSTAEEYYAGFFISAISRCFEIRYRVGERLIGVSVVDGSERWLNAVYFYFDPDESWRSPGVMNILNLIKFCRRNRIGQLYLGYLIKGISSMSYKASFKPHELLLGGSWRSFLRN